MRSPRSADGHAARVAVLGAAAPQGIQLREALEQHGVDGTRVDLYGDGDGEALLGQYDGEARLIQKAELGELAEHDVIFLCEPGALPARVAAAAPADALVIDVGGVLAGPERPPVVHLDLNPQAAHERRGVLPVRTHWTILLPDLLSPCQSASGLWRAPAGLTRAAPVSGRAAPPEHPAGRAAPAPAAALRCRGGDRGAHAPRCRFRLAGDRGAARADGQAAELQRGTHGDVRPALGLQRHPA